MHKVTIDEVMGLERYERERDGFRRRIIELKKARRVAVGDRVTFVFENHDTMLFQIQEMVRAERLTDLDRIRDEVAVYNALVPEGDELSATMLIEITGSDRIREELVQLIGIDEAVRMTIGAAVSVAAQFEPGRSKEDKLSAVQYVRFPLHAGARAAFLDEAQPVRIHIEHPHYRATAEMDARVRHSLAADLEAA